jgi:hypothetical protein
MLISVMIPSSLVGYQYIGRALYFIPRCHALNPKFKSLLQLESQISHHDMNAGLEDCEGSQNLTWDNGRT